MNMHWPVCQAKIAVVIRCDLLLEHTSMSALWFDVKSLLTDSFGDSLLGYCVKLWCPSSHRLLPQPFRNRRHMGKIRTCVGVRMPTAHWWRSSHDRHRSSHDQWLGVGHVTQTKIISVATSPSHANAACSNLRSQVSIPSLSFHRCPSRAGPNKTSVRANCKTSETRMTASVLKQDPNTHKRF